MQLYTKYIKSNTVAGSEDGSIPRPHSPLMTASLTLALFELFLDHTISPPLHYFPHAHFLLPAKAAYYPRLYV